MKDFAFTGTRKGLTPAQHDALEELLQALRADGYDVAHNGCAIGADLEAALLCRRIGFRIVGHPSNLATQTASIPHDELHDSAPPRTRDKHMVRAAQLLIACPAGFEEEAGSGTWFTVQYARRRNVPVRFVWPDGSVTDLVRAGWRGVSADCPKGRAGP